MKTVKVTADNKISVIDIDLNDFRSIQHELGGYFETVKTQRMFNYFGYPIFFLVDEEGRLKNLRFNRLGCLFYGTARHGQPIVGDLIFAMQEGENLKGPDDAECLKARLLHDFYFLTEEVES